MSCWFVGLNTLIIAAIVRSAIILLRGDDAVFTLLWFAVDLTLSVSVLTALSAAPSFLLTLAMLIVAVGTAPNRTGRSRADWRFVVAPAAVFGVSVALLLYVLG